MDVISLFGILVGHETTSGKISAFSYRYHITLSIQGLLTFSLYYLIKNPEAMRKLREEVDEVLGDQTIQLGDLGKLRYALGWYL